METLSSLPKAVGTKVIVRVKKLDKMTQSGLLYIPEMAEDKHRAKDGHIVSVGGSCELGLKVGDYVFFDEFVGSRIYMKIADSMDDYLFVDEKAILIVVDKEN